MRIIFMGTPALAVPSLETLLASEHNVIAVFTQPDRASGRGRTVSFSAVKECALAHAIPVFQPETLQEETVLDHIEALQPDVICVVAYAQKIPDRLLAMPPYGCINLHPSLLPKYRGSAPFRGPILNGDKETGVTIMKLIDRWDAGDILLQESFPVDPKDTSETLEEKAVKRGAKLLLQAVNGLAEKTITPLPQDESQATYLKQIKKEEGRICFSNPAEQIERQVRACIPWPSAYTTLDGKLFKIWDADFIEKSVTPEGAAFCCPYGNLCHGQDGSEMRNVEPGTITWVSKEEIIVRCGKGCLKLKEVQIEGKKRMSVCDFLKGKKVERGVRFGGTI